MYPPKLIAFALLAASAGAQQDNQPRLKTRDELSNTAPRPEPQSSQNLWVMPAGTKIPLQLRQPISTKTAQPGDPIYAQTTFPIVIAGNMAIPAGTWVQGIVDGVKRAGRVKGVAELQFHLTALIYSNGYTLDIASAIDQVPGDTGTAVKEPGTVAHDSEKGKDLDRVLDNASKAGVAGALAGAAARPTIRSFGVGGLSGIAAGTLIALLQRGSDVTFPAGTAVEIALTKAMAVEREKAIRPANAQ